METIVCLKTAFEIYHALRCAAVPNEHRDPSLRLKPLRLDRTGHTRLDNKTPGSRQVEQALELNRPLLEDVSLPVHVLVGRGASRRAGATVSPHVWSSELVPGSLVRIAPGILASSPEHLFLQMATRLDDLGLIWLGSLLCATFSQRPNNPGPLLPAYPLTTVARLEAHLAPAAERGVHGARNALRLVRHVVESAASTREIMLPLIGCLPLRMGGRAITKPQLNRYIEFDKRFASTRGRAGCSCDLLWPEARLALEYDSDLYHASSKGIARGNDKQSALQSAGYRMEAMSTDQFEHVASTDSVLLRIMAHLGLRDRTTDCAYDWQKRRWELRKRLWALEKNGIAWP